MNVEKGIDLDATWSGFNLAGRDQLRVSFKTICSLMFWFLGVLHIFSLFLKLVGFVLRECQADAGNSSSFFVCICILSVFQAEVNDESCLNALSSRYLENGPLDFRNTGIMHCRQDSLRMVLF